MQGFKLKYVGPYMERLMRLAEDAHLRGELTAFNLSSGAEGIIRAEDRFGKLSLQCILDLYVSNAMSAECRSF